jgi:hypothetical protein
VTKLVIGFSLTISLFAATTTRGFIADAKCGAKHQDASDKSAKCAQGCIKGGQAAVLVTADGKVYQLANQDAAKEHAGLTVSVEGDVKGDTIQNTKISKAQ